MEKSDDAKNVAAPDPETTVNTHGLTEVRTSLEKLKLIIDNKWQLFSVEEQHGIEVVFADIMGSLTKYERGGDEDDRIAHALKHYRSDEAALSMLTRMADEHPNSFVPHAVAICEIVKEMKFTYKYLCKPHRVYAKDRKLLEIVAGLLPTLVHFGDENNKENVYELLMHTADHFCRLLAVKHIPSTWNCLKIALKNGGPILAKEEFYIAFMTTFVKIRDPIALDSKKEDFRTLLLLMEAYFRDVFCSPTFETETTATMYTLYRTFWEGNDFVSYLPDIMELVFKMLDQGKEFILNFMYFESSHESMVPYLPQLKEKFQTFLVKRIVKQGSASGQEVAFTYQNPWLYEYKTKFIRFFNGVALDLFDKTEDHKVRAGLFSFFSGLDTSEKVEYLPQIMSRLLASLRMSEANITENIDSIHDEKEQAIKALKPLARQIEKEFEPFVETSFDAVEAQLTHPKDTIREAAVRASAQFVILFREMNKIERSQVLLAKMVPKYAKILKTDSASAVAVAVFKGYSKLLFSCSFDGKMQLVNEIFNCVNDVMGARVACQIGADFYDNPKLINAALEVFGKCGKKMQPFEFAIYFSSILPILCEKLKSAKQTPSKYSVSANVEGRILRPLDFEDAADLNEIQSESTNLFKIWVYRTFKVSMFQLKAYSSSSFETLFPIFLFGIRDKCELARQEAVAGLMVLLEHSEEKAKDESAAFSQEMSNLLAHEKCKEVIDEACGAIARLILRRSELVSVEQFLPILIEKVEKNEMIWKVLDVFQCFQMLLAENNPVLLRSLHSIVSIAFKRVRPQRNVSRGPAIMTFLRECHKRFRYVIDNAMLQDPEDGKTGQLL